jgi:prepilin-type N-terminal cleavage/methylation domain-containing protein
MKSFRSHGFTLIELVMTMVVMTAIAIPTALLLGAHIENMFWINEGNFAANLARLEMERVRVMNYNNITSATLANYLGYNYDVIRTVSVQDPLDALGTDMEEMKEVKVFVRKAGSTKDLMTMVTYITKNVANGQ